MGESQTTIIQAYTPSMSLWKLVEDLVPFSEQEEIKSMLGYDMVDQSLELHSEIEMLLDIWREMRDEAQEIKITHSQLPEPPNLRERLIQEINFFAESVKDKARQKGIDPKDILKKHNTNVIDYASDASRPGSSMGRSSRASDGRETPMMVASPDRILRSMEVSDEIEAVNEQLNVNKFEEVCEHLRSTLEKEIDQLHADIEFLQRCLDDEADIRDCIDTSCLSREPTLLELREERASLERELLQTDLKYTPQVDKPLFNDNLKKPLPVCGSPIHASELSYHGPVKANHLIDTKMIPDRQTASPSVGKAFSRVGADTPLKAVHDIQITKTQADNDFSIKHSPRLQYKVKGESSSFLPSPPKVPISDNVKQSIMKRTQQPSVDKTQSYSTPLAEGGGEHKPVRGRRTLSPGRVRVVNISSVVGVHPGKMDNISSVNEGTQDFKSSSPLLPFSPVPPNSSAPTVESSLRPSSADRFRNMVMGCRDGE